MKLLKKLAILAMSLTLCLGTSALVTACGGNNDSSSSSVASSVESSTTSSTESSAEATTNAYTFIVLNSNGSPAENINVQLCMLGNGAACFMPMLTDASGKVEYTFDGFVEGEYEIHLFDSTMTTSLEFDGPTTTTATFSTITLTLK